MPISFEVLGSSSKGNCYIIQTGDSNILVDIGFSGKRIIELLTKKNLCIDDIHGVFITHEHNDHAAGIRGLSKFKNLQFFANQLTANIINNKLQKQICWNIFENEKHIQFRDLDIVAFSLPHDAADPVGYVFSIKLPNNKIGKICIATDLGYIPHGLPHYTDDANLLILEANHDLHMLEIDTKRPIYIKNRIRGKYGHLSNDSAISFIINHNTPKWQTVLLAHLSHDCNKQEAILSTLSKHNFPHIFDIQIVNPNLEGHTQIFLK